MDRDFNNELKEIDEFIDQLGDIAGADGKITAEEQTVLDEIMNDLSDYRILVMDVLEDGVVTEEESVSMQRSLDNIINNASKIALSDGRLSDDEEILIESLISFAR
ncbi:MAG: hypothetical protein ACXAE3_15070 [Candidatus Kariarchaeaceae archaeon]|jgi:tellurite resistance protein